MSQYFLFVALCASVFINFLLAMVAFRGFGGAGVRVEEPLPRFREIVIERGARMVPPDCLITNASLISSSIPGNVSDSMVEDMRLALQQARDDSRVKAIVLEIDSPGGEVTAADQIYNAVAKVRAPQAGRGLHGFAGGVRRLLYRLRRKIFDGERDDDHRQHWRHYSNAELRAIVQQKIGLASVVFKSGQVQRHFEWRPADDSGRARVDPEFRHANLRQISRIVAKERSLPAKCCAITSRTAAFFLAKKR